MGIRDKGMIPKITALTLTSNAVDYSHVFDSDTKIVEVMNRSSNAVKYAFVSGGVAAGNYRTIPADATLSKDNIHLLSPHNTWYFRGTNNGDVIEIEEWK